jgi:hypothetical protein
MKARRAAARALASLRGVTSVASLTLSISACAGVPVVARGYGGRVVEGHSIEPDAYAAFLSGAIAEASDDARGALAAYERAGQLDAESPEVWARVGALRCTLDPRGRRADDAFARALALDPTYAGAWAAKARCASARKDETAMQEAARRAAALDPTADGASALLARAGGAVRDAAARDALVALTATARDRVAAWDALASWAASRGDVALWSLALETVVKLAPSRRAAVAGAAEELAGAGQLGAARAVAATAYDAGDAPLADERHALASRLAVDDAIARGDAAAVRLRATRARVSLEEAGARAWLSGHRDLARDLVAPVTRADPGASGARLVLAACDGKDLAGAASDARRAGATASAAATIAFGVALARAASPAEARAALGAVTHAPIVAGDDRVVRAAVELVSRGVLDPAALPPDGLVELAVLRGAGSAEGPSAPDVRLLDARHEYLALALADPKGAGTKALADRLASVAATDAVVAGAAALVQIGVGGPLDAGGARALMTLDPTDPLLAAIALRLATRTGDIDAASKARATLTAIGGREVREGEPSGTKKSGAAF